MSEQAHLDGLRKYFKIEDRGPAYVLECRTCECRWQLVKRDGGKVHAGNVLHLLNHAHSHPVKPSARKQAALSALNE
jgi:hypothetical protein